MKDNAINHDFDDTALVVKYENFLDRIVKKLSDPEKLNRLCTPLVSTGMPEIWEDNLAFEDFSESFFEYVASCLNGQNLPVIIRSISEKTGIDRNMNTAVVEKKFVEYFKNDAEWSDECWRNT